MTQPLSRSAGAEAKRPAEADAYKRRHRVLKRKKGLSMLSQHLQSVVQVVLSNGSMMAGVLAGFDSNMNLLLRDVRLLQAGCTRSFPLCFVHGTDAISVMAGEVKQITDPYSNRNNNTKNNNSNSNNN